MSFDKPKAGSGLHSKKNWWLHFFGIQIIVLTTRKYNIYVMFKSKIAKPYKGFEIDGKIFLTIFKCRYMAWKISFYELIHSTCIVPEKKEVDVLRNISWIISNGFLDGKTFIKIVYTNIFIRYIIIYRKGAHHALKKAGKIICKIPSLNNLKIHNYLRNTF